MNKKQIVAPESKKHKMTEVGEEIPHSTDMDVMTQSHRRALAKYEVKDQFLSPIDRITQHKLFIMRVKFPGSDEAYPLATQALYRFISKYYPYAQGGALYVDEPRNDQEIDRAYKRRDVMKKLGHRYVIVEHDTTYEMLLEQLGEL